MSDGAPNVGDPGRSNRRRSRGGASELVSPEAASKVEEAARAVGLSPEALVNLVCDSGLQAERPRDEITEVMSLQDLGKRLHNLAVTHPVGERQKWFTGLLPTQKKALLTILRERGYATAVIAQEYGVAPMEVVEAHNQFADQLGKNVINTRLSTIAGAMQLAAERAQQGAMETGDWSTFWRIQKELTMLLQSMGVVDRAAQKIEIDNRISVGFEEKQAEVERIVKFKEMGNQRRLEIEQAKEEDDDLALLENEEGTEGVEGQLRDGVGQQPEATGSQQEPGQPEL